MMALHLFYYTIGAFGWMFLGYLSVKTAIDSKVKQR